MRNVSIIMLTIACIPVALRLDNAAWSEEPTVESEDAAGLWNLPFPTGGGKQFWTDVFVHRAWRIQRNVYTDHHRLLDDRDVRRTWGTYDACRAEFDKIRRESKLPQMSGEAVVTLHGLGRTRGSMGRIGAYLAEQGDYEWINVCYASTRDTIDSHAAALRNVLRNLEGVETVHFVAHSMGNLVIRRYLADRAEATDDGPVGPQIGRIVMLAPPNNGSALAVQLRNNPVFRVAFGTSGAQLAREWDDLAARLATPAGDFGVVAGSYAKGVAKNPLLEGGDDLVVSVEETRLAGASDFLVVPVAHTFIMNDPKVHQCTLRFLQQGYFNSEDERQPIEADPGF